MNPPHLLSNAAVFNYSEDRLSVLLLANPNSADTRQKWHLPISSVKHTQTTLAAIETSLRHQSKLSTLEATYREQLYSWDNKNGAFNQVCVSYLYLTREISWHKGSTQVGLFPVKKLPRLSLADHQTVKYALARLKSKAVYTNICGLLLAKEFTLDELQTSFECLARQKVDRRNFRKKVTNIGLVEPAKDASRPQKYNLTSSNLELLKSPFKVS